MEAELKTQCSASSGSLLDIQNFKPTSDLVKGLPDSSVGKESACSAGDPGLILGSGRSPGEGIGYPLQYSWASLVAQMVKNLPSEPDICPDSSVSKESACNAGDPGLIPGLGRPPGEGIGYSTRILGLSLWLSW